MEDKRKKGMHILEKLSQQLGTLFMRKDRLAILLLGGILLLVIALPVSEGDKETDGRRQIEAISGEASEKPHATEEYAAYLEQKLANTLSKVKGVGDVEVMVTLKSSAERVIEKDTESNHESTQEQDSQGGSRNTLNSASSQSTVYSGEGQTDPYITKELAPAVEGVVVIAQGGDDAVTVQNITEAVQALFEIDTHKIKVMKGN